MKAIIILSIICFILFLGLLWCFSSILNLCEAIKSILKTMRIYDEMLDLNLKKKENNSQRRDNNG